MSPDLPSPQSSHLSWPQLPTASKSARCHLIEMHLKNQVVTVVMRGDEGSGGPRRTVLIGQGGREVSGHGRGDPLSRDLV